MVGTWVWLSIADGGAASLTICVLCSSWSPDSAAEETSTDKRENQSFSPPVCSSRFIPPVFLSLTFSSQDTATDEARAVPQQSLWQQGWAHPAHTHSASQTLAEQIRSCDQLLCSLQQALLRYQILPSCLRLTGVEELSVLSSKLIGLLLQCQLWDRIRRIKFPVWRMIKRGDFTCAKCCQKLKFNKLMVNVFSAVRYFKLKIKMNVSTALCIHVLLLTSACSCCLRRFIPQPIAVSFQSKSVRSILCYIWPFSL